MDSLLHHPGHFPLWLPRYICGRKCQDNVARGKFSPEGGKEASHQATFLHDTQNGVDVNRHPQHCAGQTSPETARVMYVEYSRVTMSGQKYSPYQ